MLASLKPNPELDAFVAFQFILFSAMLADLQNALAQLNYCGKLKMLSDSTGDRTQNLWFRRRAPYPLGHGVDCLLQIYHNVKSHYQNSNLS